MEEIWIAWIAFTIDRTLGDPPHPFHPIRIFGYGIAWAEKNMNQAKARRLKGACLSLCLVGLCYLFFASLQGFFKNLGAEWEAIFQIVFLYYALAQGSLLKSGNKLIQYIDAGSLKKARSQLSHLVGRDTHSLSEQDIKKALLETWSENLSDGVVAPLFYYFLGGIPGVMTYKMINTLDSMIGYKTSRYRKFGCFAAHLDDLANLIPARLTGLGMVLLSGRWQAFKTLFQDAPRHESPNAGYPEAALAGILDCQLGGDAFYQGTRHQRAYLGRRNRKIIPEDIQYTRRLIQQLSIFFLILFSIIQWLILR
ncbi:MAG: adenosylcobinamide-phosphate synthase CbiB [Cytophagales bacterium]|nr:adenosylcobinamide-phosphate synthase CbiB [Cytophagales bacterium]